MWKFLAKNWFSLLTLAVGIIVIVAQRFDKMNPEHVPLATLGLLLFLVTSNLIEQRKQAAETHKLVESLPTKFHVEGCYVREISDTDEIMEYLAHKTEVAKKQVLQASIDIRRTSAKKEYRYDSVRDGVISKNDIYYSYIGCVDETDGARRIELGRKFSKHKSGLNKFSARFLETKTISLLNFVIFDDDEVVARQPYGSGQMPVYVVMHGEAVATLFRGYFDRLWDEAKEQSNI